MIDTKTLRIGSHVLVNGKRVRVEGLTTMRMMKGNPLKMLVFPATIISKVYVLTQVESIPITPALLAELGFEHIPGSDMWVLACNRHIQIGRITDDTWTVTIYLRDVSLIDRCMCRYLHEAESFLSLHNVELITE